MNLNPQDFLQKMMNNNAVMQNPVAKNTFEMLKKGDSKGLEQVARNLYQENGVDIDKAMKQIKSQFGM